MENDGKVGLGITSMILGIMSIVTMCFIVISVTFGVLAIIFGILSIVFEKKNGIRYTGLILGIISIAITLVLYLVLGVMEANLFMVPQWYKL